MTRLEGWSLSEDDWRRLARLLDEVEWRITQLRSLNQDDVPSTAGGLHSHDRQSTRIRPVPASEGHRQCSLCRALDDFPAEAVPGSCIRLA